MFTSIAFCYLSLWVSRISAQDNSIFKITAPKAGDTVTVSKYTTDGVTVPIEWTVPEAIADRPVLISLVQGDDISSLETVSQLEGSAPNNGSYTWRGDAFDSALVFGYTHGAPSGCNYSIALKIWTDTVYSPYFTIVNPDDGGLNNTAQCPSGDNAVGPTSRTYTSTSDGTITSDDTSEPASSTSATASSGTSSSASTATDTSNISSSKSTSGVSTTTLAIAVAVPIVVLLLAFAGIIWLGIRKGWFVRKTPQDGSTVEKHGVLAQQQGSGTKPTGGDGEVRELHADDRPHQLDYSPVHELEGKEGERGRI